MEIIKPGDVFQCCMHPWMITPITESVFVVWNDGENIHYRKESQFSKVLQTPIARFIEAISLRH
jgi:hypothetical protein